MAKARIIEESNKLRSVKSKEFPRTKFTQKLPFRVRFTNIQIEGYSPSNPGGVGVAVIGFNNYIL